MISSTLMICFGVASATIVIALMIRKPRNRFPARPRESSADWRWRDLTFAGMLLSFAEAVGLARARQSSDGNSDSGYSWHGSHLDHGAGSHFSDGGFSDDGRGGFGGGDGAGGI